MQTIERDSVALAVDDIAGVSPRVIFCCGFNSNRLGTKASALEAWCSEQGLAFTRFDYSGHGDSEGDFAEGSISNWLADTLAIIDHATEESIVLVGSSMGGWLALLAALARPKKVVGLLLIACAADMTRYYPIRLAGLARQQDEKGRSFYEVENQYDDEEPYRIYQHLIDDGEQHFLLHKTIELSLPVRLIHGMQDDVVEWQRSVEVAQNLRSSDVSVCLIKEGDHRLSEPSDMRKLLAELSALIKQLNG